MTEMGLNTDPHSTCLSVRNGSCLNSLLWKAHPGPGREACCEAGHSSHRSPRASGSLQQEVLGGLCRPPGSAAAPRPPLPNLHTPLLSCPVLAPGASRRNMECQTRMLFPLHLFTFRGLLQVLNGIIQKLKRVTWADNSSI